MGGRTRDRDSTRSRASRGKSPLPEPPRTEDGSIIHSRGTGVDVRAHHGVTSDLSAQEQSRREAMERSSSVPSFVNIESYLRQARHAEQNPPILEFRRTSSFGPERKHRIMQSGRSVYDTILFEHIDSSTEDEDSEYSYYLDAPETLRSHSQPDLTEGTPLLGENGNGTAKENGHDLEGGDDHGHGGGDARLAGTKKTLFAIFKSFVGTGILFIPKGFYNAGMLMGIVMLVFMGVASIWGILLLLQTHRELVERGTKASTYGDIGKATYGKFGRRLVNLSVFMTQFGFCTAYFVFISKNVREAVARFTSCGVVLEEWWIMTALVFAFVPLTWVRHMKYFGLTNLIADVIVIGTVIYTMTLNVEILADQGPQEVHLIEYGGLLSFIGTSIYAFEGIAMVLPIQQSMKKKEKMPVLITNSLLGIMGLMIVFGISNYLAFGPNLRSIITLNLNTGKGDNPVVDFILIAYSLGIMLTFPLMMFPAVRMIERKLFPGTPRRSGKKWQKNGVRFSVTLLAYLVALVGQSDVDNLVSLIGGLCCTPLAFSYPALFHWKVFYDGKFTKEALGDILFFVFGMVCVALSTFISFYNWDTSGGGLKICEPGF
eukprot:Clim_evm25s139 gene=Clim_evmTU25s139